HEDERDSEHRGAQAAPRHRRRRGDQAASAAAGPHDGLLRRRRGHLRRRLPGHGGGYNEDGDGGHCFQRRPHRPPRRISWKFNQRHAAHKNQIAAAVSTEAKGE
ncbi:hypothetical protein ACJX0J_012287, partial [Zea mays]